MRLVDKYTNQQFFVNLGMNNGGLVAFCVI